MAETSASSPSPARRGHSQERLLLDYLQELEALRRGRRCVIVHLSGLQTYNRREHHMRVAANSFEQLIEVRQGQLFLMGNDDLVFVYMAEAQDAVERAVQRLRYLFGDDPLLADEGTPFIPFASWYDMQTQFDDLVRLTQRMILEQEARDSGEPKQQDTRAELRSRQDRGDPLTPRVLGRLEEALARADLSNMVRRQYVCTISDKGVPDPLFSEMFISVKDLRETLLPGVNLASNRWLFQHLTETLDRRMLSMLGRPDTIDISGHVSLNLNLSTLLSPRFLDFDDNIPAGRRGHIVVELQKVDVFADLSTYMFAREFLQDRGYRICIDGLNHLTAPFVDRERLGADFVKLIWDASLMQADAATLDRLGDCIDRAGDYRVILCRCDSRQALQLGRAMGIGLFQGREVEQLITEDNRRRELRKLKLRLNRE